MPLKFNQGRNRSTKAKNHCNAWDDAKSSASVVHKKVISGKDANSKLQWKITLNYFFL